MFLSKTQVCKKRLVVYLTFFLVLCPNIAAVLVPFEDWPYTPAPMFAHAVTKDTPRYRFLFLGEVEDGSTNLPTVNVKQLGYYSVGANWSMMRFFFKYVYGSAEPKSVFNNFPLDTAEAFRARLELFFQAFVRELSKRSESGSAGFSRLRLIVERIGAVANEQSIERNEVGIYDLSTRRFVLTERKEIAGG